MSYSRSAGTPSAGSRSAGEQLAPALEEALERFAKPWNRLHALRVFRDDADLSANAGLWRSIVAALDEAEFFILLASPAAKRSKWVGREIEHWLAHREVDRLLLVATEGELVWDEEAGDFDPTQSTAVPDALRGAFREEPRYIDLRWVRDPAELSLDNDRFREAVADLAGTLHGRPKDEMIGEQVRQHRRTIRLARAAIVGLSLLTGAAIIAALLAVWQSRVAADQRDTARSRELSTRALAQLTVDPADSVRLAVQALELKSIPEAEQALRAALADSHTGAFAVLRGHKAFVSNAAFDPAGKRVVTASGDGTARIWDVKTGRTLAVLRAHRGLVRGAAFDPAGSRVVTAGGDTARVWDAASGKQLVVLSGHGGYVWSARFDPEGGRIVTGGEDGTARVWDAATGRRLAVLRGHRLLVVSAAFDSKGKRIVTASVDYTARIWDAVTGRPLAVLRGHGKQLTSAAFDPTGARVVTVGEDGTARIWDAITGERLAVLGGHGGAVHSVAFDPAGTRMVTTGRDGAARVWEAGGRRRLLLLRGAADLATFDPAGRRIVAVGAGGTARLWDASSGEPLTVLRGHENGLADVAFDWSGNRLVTASLDGTARVWDITPRKRLAALPERNVSGAAFEREGTRLVTTREDGTVVGVWDVATWRRLGSDGAPSLDGTDGDSQPVPRNAGPLLAVDSDGKRAVTGGEGSTALVWDLAERKVLAVLRGHSEATTSPYAVGVLEAAFDPKGERVVTTGLDQTARVWEAATGKRLAILRGHGNIIYSATFDPTGKRIVSVGQEGTVRIWAASTGRTVAVLSNASGEPAFDTAGRLLVTTGPRGTARIWDAVGGRALAVLGGDGAPIKSFALSPTGKLIVTVDEDGAAQIHTCRACGTVDDLLAEAAAYRRGLRTVVSLGGDVAAWHLERQVVLEQVEELLAERFLIDDREITEDASLEDDLGIDWLARLELIMELEDRLGIVIPEEDEQKFQTVGQLVDYVASRN